jgi:aminopeptidase N
MDAFGPAAKIVRTIRVRRLRASLVCAFFLLAVTVALAPVSFADRPYAPSRDYDLTHVRVELRFDVDQRKVMGQVTHTLSALRDGVAQLNFDSAELNISAVQVDGKDAHFSTDAQKLHVDLSAPSKAGQQYQVSIRYDGKPKKGLFFILPDKSRPNQTRQIWSQGEAEDTHYYIPIYDYPNDRTTTEMILTVPSGWETVSNGRLVSVTDAGQGMKTWSWSQSQPVSTYLISLVAGEFDKQSITWRNIPVEYIVPRGMKDRIPPTFTRTPDMLSYFSDRLGVPYPWDKYDQSMVDQFVVGGMENVSATTETTRNLLHPVLARESLQQSDGLISHEMSHQWFGDLVTCRDWGNLWLNEGFATFMATLWQEHQFGADNAAYARWRTQEGWIRQGRLYSVPVVTRDFDDSLKYAGNIYDKAGLILQMLREQLGDEAFFGGLKHYLEKNRLGNVVTEDLVTALEESTGKSLDHFFDQWIYGAGAPRFTVTQAYDAAAHQLSLTVKQTQRVAGSVGLFDVPVEIAVATAGGNQSFPIRVTQAEETFNFPLNEAPLNVIFDRGSRILKSVDFRKSPDQWIYQLQHADEAVDRAVAAEALGDVKDNPAVIAVLGDAAKSDHFWGVRVQALTALGRIGGAEAGKQVLAATSNTEPWVRDVAVEQLSRFKNDATLPERLADMSRHDAAYRVRATALVSYAQLKPSGGLSLLQESAKTDSPDDVIRRAALRAMGPLGDDKAVATLLDWSAEGKPIALRTSAIGSLAQLDKKNENIGKRLIALLDDEAFDIRSAAVTALGERDDASAIPALEAMRRRSDLPVNFSNVIDRALERLRHVNPEADTAPSAQEAGPQGTSGAAAGDQQVLNRLTTVEQALTEMNDRLKRIEQALAAK